MIQSAHASVIVNGYISDCFDVHRGVRQGDPLSLHLFLLFLEPLLKMVNHDKHIDGVCIPGSKKTILKYVAYADDITFTLSNVHAITRMLHGFEEYERATGLSLNMRKLNGLIVKKNTIIIQTYRL